LMPDRDVWQAAPLFVKRHGDDAIREARPPTKRKAPREGLAQAGLVQSLDPRRLLSLPCAREDFLTS
jgi:hypothetical protein